MSKTKKINKGQYLYKGYKIYCIGYYKPEHKIVWEAEDKNGSIAMHGFSKKEIILMIDNKKLIK